MARVRLPRFINPSMVGLYNMCANLCYNIKFVLLKVTHKFNNGYVQMVVALLLGKSHFNLIILSYWCGMFNMQGARLEKNCLLRMFCNGMAVIDLFRKYHIITVIGQDYRSFTVYVTLF